MRRVVFVAVSLVLLAMVAGCSSNPEQTVGRGMVEVDGVGLSYWCAGSGSPSVLIEQGLFGTSRRLLSSWSFAWESFADRVAAVDGQSDPGHEGGSIR